MALDTAQRATLAAHIQANTDPAVVQALADRNDTALAALYNADSAFVVWREAIQPSEYREAMVWTEVDQLQVGKARIWEWITQNMTLAIDATKANVRAGLAEVFSAQSASRSALLAIAKEAASLAESIFASGEGSTANPGTRVFVGNVTTTDIGRALNENPGA